MTETEPTPTTAEPTTNTADPTNDDRDITTTLYWGALVGFVLLAAVAALRFYLSGSRAISVWVSPEYEPLFQAAFNLVLLLVSGVGISLVVRRLSE